MLRFIGTYQDSSGREQSLRIEVNPKPDQLVKKGKIKVLPPQERIRFEALVNAALEEFCKTKGKDVNLRSISKVEVTEDNKIHLFAGSKLLETLDVKFDQPAAFAFHPQVKLNDPTSVPLGRSLRRVASRSPLDRFLEFFSWCSHLLFGPGEKKQAQEQKLFALLLNHPYSKGIPDLHDMPQSERIKAVRKVVAQEGKGFSVDTKPIIAKLASCEKSSKAWEDLIPRYKEIKQLLARLQDARNPRSVAERKKYENEMQKLKKRGEDQLAQAWKNITSLKAGGEALLPLFFTDELSNQLIRVTRHADSYQLHILETDPENILSKGLTTDRAIKKERAVTFENLTLDELKTQFDIQRLNFLPNKDETKQNEVKTSNVWKKSLAEGPIAAKRSVPSALSEDYIILRKNNTLAKPLLAYLGVFDSGPELKRLKLRMRLAALSRFYDQVKFNLKDNETNFILLKDGMEKVSRTISKMLEENILSPDEVKQIAPVMQRLQQRLSEIDNERNQRWQMNLRNKSPISFPQVTLSEQLKLHPLPDNLQAQTIQDITSIKTTWSEPPSLDGLKNPSSVTETLNQCLAHAKGLYEQKDYSKLLFHVNKVYLNLQIPQDPDAQDDFWQKVDSNQRNACSELLGKMQIYLFESVVKQKLATPFPPEIALGFNSLYVVLDRLLRLEDPTYCDYRFSAQDTISWTHLSHPQDRERGDEIFSYQNKCKNKRALSFDNGCDFRMVALGTPDHHGVIEKTFGDYMQERRAYLEKNGKEIVVSNEVAALTPPSYHVPLSQNEVAARKKRIEIATDLGDKNLLAKPFIHYRFCNALAASLMDWRSEMYGQSIKTTQQTLYNNEKMSTFQWDGQSPYFKRETNPALLRIRANDHIKFSLVSTPERSIVSYHSGSNYSKFTPIPNKLLEQGLPRTSRSESILAAHFKGSKKEWRIEEKGGQLRNVQIDEPTRIQGLTEEASRDRLLVDSTRLTKLEDCLGYYWENRHLLHEPQHQEDLRRILFSASSKSKDWGDLFGDSEHYKSASTLSLALKEELKNPDFLPYLQEFFDRNITLFENEQNFEVVANLTYLAAQIKSHVAFWDSKAPNLSKDYEADLRLLLKKAPEDRLDTRRQIYGYLACLSLYRQNLTDQQQGDLFKARLIHAISEPETKAFHPLREHQVRRVLDKWTPMLRARLQTDISFRNETLSEVIAECFHTNLNSKEWSGEFPLISNGDFQVEIDKGIVFKNGKASAYLPASIKTNPTFLKCFPANFSPLTEIILIPPEKGQSQGFLCYQFTSEGKKYRALAPSQGELILQKEETVDGKTAWFQYTPHSDHTKFESSFGDIVQSAMRGGKPGPLTIIRTLLGLFKKRLEMFIPSSLVEKSWWINTKDRTQMLVLDKNRELAFVGQLSAKKGTQNLESLRDMRSNSSSKNLQLINSWSNRSKEWGVFREFAHSKNTLIWGKNGVPSQVEFPEHDLRFHYDEKTKQWNCLKEGLEGYHLSAAKHLPALGSLRNAIIVENKLGEKKALLASRPLIPIDPETAIPNSIGRLFKAVWNRLRNIPNSNLLHKPPIFDRMAPSELYVFEANQIGTQLSLDSSSHHKHGVAPHFYLAQLYLHTNQFNKAMEQLSLAVNKNGYAEEEKEALSKLFTYCEASQTALSDVRFSAFLLHLAKVAQENQNPEKPTPLPPIQAHYQNYLKEVGKGNIGNIPEALLLSPEDEKNLWRTVASTTPEFVANPTPGLKDQVSNPFYQVLQNRKEQLWPASAPTIDTLRQRKIKALSPKDDALAAKVHEVMRKSKLTSQEQALKEVSQKLSSFHQFRKEQIQKKGSFAELRTWLRSLPEDDYIETLRNYLEAAIDVRQSDELPKEFQNLSAIGGQDTSPAEIQKLLERCAEAVQSLKEQQPECCHHHLISTDADLASHKIESQHSSQSNRPEPHLALKGVTTLLSPDEIGQFFKAEDADTKENREKIGAELKGVLEHVAEHNPNHTHISKQICKDLLEDYDSFLESYDYKTYQWKGDSKKELGNIENMLNLKKENLSVQAQKLDQAIDEILNKSESIPGAGLKKEFQKIGMGAKSVSKQHLRHLFLQHRLNDLNNFNANLTPSDLERLNALITNSLIAETGLQQISRTHSILNLMKSSDDYRKEMLPLFVETLKAQRVYDPWKHPEFLVMEYEGNILFRQKQVSVIHEMIQNPNCIKQLIMGAGKTTVILPLIALLRADGEHLSIVISTQALYGAMKNLLLKQSKKLLNQEGFPFEWERYSHKETLQRTKGLYARFLSAIENRQYILATRESFQCFEASYLELINQKKWTAGTKLQEINEALSELKKVRNLLKEKGVVTADEVDKLMDPKEKTIFPTGPAQKYNEDELEVTLEVYNKMLQSPKIGLRNNQQGNMTEEEQTVERRALAEHFVSSDQGLALLATDEKQKEFIKANRADFIEYLMSKKGEKELPAIAKFVDESPKEEAISTLRGLLSEILKTTLAATYSKDYIRSKKDKETTTPTEEKDVPREGSQFGHRLENLCYILQDYLHQGVAAEKLQSIITLLHQNAVKQVEKEKIAYEKTAAAQTFANIFGQSLQELKKTNTGSPMLADCQRLSQQLTQDEQKLFRFLRENLLNKPTLYGELIEQNSQQFVSMFSAFGGFSGTLNQFIFHRCNKKTIEQARDAGTDTRTLFLLLRNNRRLIQEGNPNGIVIPYSPKDEMDKITAANTPERIQHLFNHLVDFDLICDAGGIVQNCSDEKAVELLPQTNKAKVYYDEGGVPVIKTIDGKLMSLRESDIPREKRVTWLPERYARGADVPQHYYAKGVFSIAEKMDLDYLLQSVWRLRGLGESQLAYILVAVWQEKHLPKTEKEALAFESILINAIKEKGISEAENNLRKAKDELEDIVRDVVRAKMLSASPDEEERLMNKYRQFFVTKIGNKSSEEFKRADLKEDPLVQLQQLRNDLLALCNANPDDLSEAGKILSREEYDFAADANKERFKAYFADEVRAEVSSATKTQVRIQTEAEQQVQQKLAVRQYAEEPKTHPNVVYPSLSGFDGLVKADEKIREEWKKKGISLTYVADNLDEIEDAVAGKTSMEPYFHYSMFRLDVAETPKTFVSSAHEIIHPAFSKNLKFTDNWFPLYVDQFIQEYKTVSGSNMQKSKLERKTNPDGTPVVAKPLKAFDHPLQQPVHFVKVKFDPRDNSWEVRLLSKEDQDGEKKLINEDIEVQKKKGAQNSQVQVGLYDLRSDTFTAVNNPDLKQKMKNNLEPLRYIIEAKVLAGQQHYNPQEKKIIDEWLQDYYQKNGPQALDEFCDFIRNNVLAYYPTQGQVAENSYFFKTAKNLLIQYSQRA